MTDILLLEDSETARIIYRRYLRSQSDFNCQILEATTLTEGWQIWQQNRPDLVLVDVNLPDGSGLEFLEMMGADYPDRNLPAIVLTARDDEATVMRAMELGAADYLIKENITAIALNISIRNQLRYAAALKREIARSQQQEAAIAEVALRIRQSLDLDEILTCAVREVREVLSVDRAVIYQFNRHNNSGKIVAESVTYPWRSCLDRELEDNCFEDKLALAYREGRIFVANDIYTSNLTQCHLQLLAEFQVRANIAVPILLPNTESAPLWGLLIVHQCSRSRNWQQTNIQLLQRLSVQLAIAIQQAELYQSLHHFNAELEQKVADRTQELRFLAQTAELIYRISMQIRSSLDLQTILDTTVGEIRAALQCDRVIIYQFRDDFTGSVVTESILEGGRSVLHSEASDPCITPEWIEPYRQGRIRVVRDIYQEAMTICHQELLLGFDIRAKLMVPIVVEERLWGLMIASHRDRPREWQSREIEMVRQLSIQVAIAIKQATIYQKAQTEIVERQKTEALVMDSERRYASLAAASPVGIFRTDLEGNCIYANDRCCQMIGLSPEACMGAGWRQGLHPEDRALVAAEWQRSQEENRPFQLEYRFQTPDGVETWVYGQIVPERDAKGQVVSYLGTITDISDRKQTEIALQESQRLMQRIADTSSSVLYLYDVAEQRNIYVNSAIANVLGITPEEIRALGAGFMNYFMHPDDLPRVADHFQRLNNAGDGQVLELEYRVRNAAGEWRWLSSRDTVFSRNADGQVGQIVGVAEDITDRLEAETNIKQLNQQLENRVQQRTAKLRQREEELRHLSDRLELAIKSGAIAIWDWDVVNNILIWDDRMYELYGITGDEFTNVYETWVSRLHPEDRTLGSECHSASR